VDSISQWEWWSGGAAADRENGLAAAASQPPRTELAIGAAYGVSHGDGNQFLASATLPKSKFSALFIASVLNVSHLFIVPILYVTHLFIAPVQMR
jgi:hypothetical protein